MANLRKIFGKIYDENVEKIYRFIFLKVNSQEIGQDLTSETFLKGWEAFQNNSKEIHNPRAFLYQIARNLVIDYYRTKGRTETISTEFAVALPDPRPTLEDKAALHSDLEIIKTGLVKLNDDYREVITWHYIDDLSIREIARVLDKSEGAVRVMLHRALETLKNGLKEA